MAFWDWKKLDEDAKKELEEAEKKLKREQAKRDKAARTTPEQRGRKGFTRDKSGRLVRTDESASKARQSGGTDSLRQRELERRGEGRHTSAINISHDFLIDAAVSELNQNKTLLGFWDFIETMAKDAQGQRWRYTGEMANPDKWTSNYIERWLNQNILEIWRRTHGLQGQLTAEAFKQKFLTFSEDDMRSDFAGRRSGKEHRGLMGKGKPKIIDPPSTIEDRLRQTKGRTTRRAQDAVGRGKSAGRNLASRVKSGASGALRRGKVMGKRYGKQAWRKKGAIATGARRLATRRFSDEMYTFAKKKEEDPNRQTREMIAGLAGSAAGLGLAAYSLRKGKMPKRPKRRVRKGGYGPHDRYKHSDFASSTEKGYVDFHKKRVKHEGPTERLLTKKGKKKRIAARKKYGITHKRMSRDDRGWPGSMGHLGYRVKQNVSGGLWHQETSDDLHKFFVGAVTSRHG